MVFIKQNLIYQFRTNTIFSMFIMVNQRWKDRKNSIHEIKKFPNINQFYFSKKYSNVFNPKKHVPHLH